MTDLTVPEIAGAFAYGIRAGGQLGTTMFGLAYQIKSWGCPGSNRAFLKRAMLANIERIEAARRQGE